MNDHVDSGTQQSFYERGKGPMGEYIADLQQKYNKVRKFNMVLPNAVLAF